MKIQAKEAKIGQTIKWGVVTITIERIEKDYQKNGVEVLTFFGPAIRSAGRGFKPYHYKQYDISPKSETIISLK